MKYRERQKYNNGNSNNIYIRDIYRIIVNPANRGNMYAPCESTDKK